MPDLSFSRAPRFKLGDQVVVVGPSTHHAKEGVVTDVIEASGDFVYRYCVRFSDESSARFFGFELDLVTMR